MAVLFLVHMAKFASFPGFANLCIFRHPSLPVPPPPTPHEVTGMQTDPHNLLTYLFILIAQILCTLSVSSFPFDSNCPEQLDAFWSEIDLAIFYQGAEQRASAEMCDGAAGEISIIAWHWKDQL